MEKGLKIDKETSVEKLFRLTDDQKKSLKKLGIKNLRDLFYYFPFRYGAISKANSISSVNENGEATIFGLIKSTKAKKTWKSRVAVTVAKIDDGTGLIEAIWFNQPYISKMFPEGSFVKLSGKISVKDGKKSMANPHIEKSATNVAVTEDSLFGEGSDEYRMMPAYSETRALSSNWFYHAIQKVLRPEILKIFDDPIPTEILEKYNLPKLQTALVWIHTPKKESDAMAARKRFAFEEIFFIQIQKQKDRALAKHSPTHKLSVEKSVVQNFIKSFPFEPTAAQTNAIETTLRDMYSEQPMSRLIEGDVGSGKTAVASVAIYATILSHPKNAPSAPLQAVMMAPTEILAKQHYENFIEYFKHTGLQIGLITGSGCYKFPSKINRDIPTPVSRAQFLKWVKSGELPVIVGTHALIQKSVEFKHLALVIIDEQHRFGTNQRKNLARKEGHLPHLLSMTATPIPRTLALTMYGDLDLTVIDEMPKGRKKIITEVVSERNRKQTYIDIRKEIADGRQAFVICPRIDEPDPDKQQAIIAKSVKAEAERLREKEFAGLNVVALHGKMKPKEKEDIMREFSEGKINVLVSTSVVEVGVNVPNATVIIIEGAERFGLAQLHQLRGRVMRSTHQPYCYVFTQSDTETTVNRLKAFAEAKNGFELAEKDLENRGAGQLVGGKQWGISDVAMEALRNLKMVEAAREEAKRIIDVDPNLKTYPILKNFIENNDYIHFE